MRSADQTSASPLGLSLHVLSAVYGAAQKLRAGGYRRNLLPARQLPCRVVSVGNITVGGTGKTPMTIFLARQLKQKGHRVAIVSRGYKGLAEGQGGVVSDGKRLLMNSEAAGDEPYMMAARLAEIPVIVGKNRFEAGQLAVGRFGSDVIVLDDAFQHLQLKRDVDIVLLDCNRPFGNTHLLPRGVLREPLTALKRATALVLTRCRDDDTETAADAVASLNSILPQTPVFKSAFVPYCFAVEEGTPPPQSPAAGNFPPRDFKDLNTLKAFAFAGIARNDDFQRTIESLGVDVRGFLDFPDHHSYAPRDLQTICRAARQAGARQLITTEKDCARLTGKGGFPLDLLVVGVRATFQDEGRHFIDFVRDRL